MKQNKPLNQLNMHRQLLVSVLSSIYNKRDREMMIFIQNYENYLHA